MISGQGVLGFRLALHRSTAHIRLCDSDAERRKRPLQRLGRSEKKWSEFSRILLLMAEIRRSQVEVGSLIVNHGMPYLVREVSYQYFIISFHGKNEVSLLKCTQFIRKSSMWVVVDHSQKNKTSGSFMDARFNLLGIMMKLSFLLLKPK